MLNILQNMYTLVLFMDILSMYNDTVEINCEGVVWVRIMFILKSNHNNNCDVWLKSIACNCLLICDPHYWKHDGICDK